MQKESPIAVIKCVKTKAEIDGMIRANAATSLCEVKFLKWVEDHSGTGITECDAVDQLHNYYSQQEGFKVWAEIYDLESSFLAGAVKQSSKKENF